MENAFSNTSFSNFIFLHNPWEEYNARTGTLQMLALAKTMTGAEWNGEKMFLCVLLSLTHPCTVVLVRATAGVDLGSQTDPLCVCVHVCVV